MFCPECFGLDLEKVYLGGMRVDELNRIVEEVPEESEEDSLEESHLEVADTKDPDKLVDPTLVALAQAITEGFTTHDIAIRLKRSDAWVRSKKNDPQVISIVDGIQRDVLEASRSTIIKATESAADTLMALCVSGPPMVRLSAAKDILDRVGLRAPDKKQVENIVTMPKLPSDERLKAIEERLERLGLHKKEDVYID